MWPVDDFSSWKQYFKFSFSAVTLWNWSTGTASGLSFETGEKEIFGGGN